VEERVAAPRATAVTTVATPSAVVTERVLSPGVLARDRSGLWWEDFALLRFGYYDDGYVDDNWFYDYYDAPVRRAVVAPVASAPYRTTWIYDRLGESGLFSW
jgi:hypothetical protein